MNGEADVLNLLDCKVDYDKNGNEKSRKVLQTVKNCEIIMDNDRRFAGKIKFNEFAQQAYLVGILSGNRIITGRGAVTMIQHYFLSCNPIMG